MLRSIGLPELLVVLVVVIFLPWMWGKIFSKAGYSAWLGLTLLVPLVNLIVICWFAFSDWPIRSELLHLRQNASRPVTPPQA
jgi:hypothetical protein